VDANDPGRADPVPVQEEGDLADAPLLREGLRDLPRPPGADAFDLPQRSGAPPITSRRSSPKRSTSLRAKTGPMPWMSPEPMYFSSPSRLVGDEVVRLSP
jgi:hypothetical protein